MIQKFSQQERKAWFPADEPLLCLSTASPIILHTTIYSQNQDPPPSSLRQFHHPPGGTPPKAERGRSQRQSLSPLSPSPPPLLPSPLSISGHPLSFLFVSTSSRFPALHAAAFGTADENIKEAKNFNTHKKREKEEEERKRQTDVGKTGEISMRILTVLLLKERGTGPSVRYNLHTQD